MYPLSDNDLDRLSREAAEQSDVGQSTSGWEQLEHRLNIELPLKKEKDRKRFLWIFFLFLLAGGSGLVWMLAEKKSTKINNNTSINIPENKKSEIVTEKNLSKSTDQVINNTKVKTGETIANKNKFVPEAEIVSSSIPPTLSNQEIKKATGLASTSISTNKPFPLSNLVSKTLSEKRIKKQAISVQFSAVKKQDKFIAKNKKSTNIDVTNEQPSNKTTENNNESGNVDTKQVVKEKNTNPPLNNSTAIVEPSTIASGKPGAATDSLENAPVVAAPPSKKNSNKKPLTNRFAFGLFTGIDFSRIRGTGNNKPGFNIGLQVSYSLSKRWSVNTGFTITKKNYSAMGKDFHPPLHYWTTYVKLNSLKGNCDMWDIPLNVRYNISMKPTITWFASTGISSYIMRKQAYTYSYKNNNANPTILTKDWKTSSQQNDWLKIINLSAGFEKKLNRSLLIQGEPYLKLPLSGTGFGKMDISSYGILVGIRYRPVFKK